MLKGIALVGEFKKITPCSWDWRVKNKILIRTWADSWADTKVYSVDTKDNFTTDPVVYPTEGQSVFVYSDSKLPREMLAGHFKRVIKKEKADVIVIPHDFGSNNITTSYMLVADQNGNALMVPDDNTYAAGDALRPGTIIDSGLYAKDFKVAYVGDFIIAKSHHTQLWVQDVEEALDGKNIITDLNMATAAQATFDLTDTADLYLSVLDLVRSTDEDTRFLGYKTLAGLAYSKFPQSTKLILQIGNGVSKNCGSNVLFMQKYLGRIYKDTISDEDWEIYKKILFAAREPSLVTNANFVEINENLQIVPKIKNED